jgi:hypothetical protein
VEDLFEWFELTYAVEFGPGWMRWRRVALPYDGGLADQPARLMQALAYIAHVWNAVIAHKLKGMRGRERYRE